jgi:hypothetical protein
MKQLPRLALLLFVCIALAELAAYGCLYVLRGRLHDDIRRSPEIYEMQSELMRTMLLGPAEHRTAVDPVLGWRYRSGFGSATDTINDQGVRARRQYSKSPAAGVTRLAAFGDSFVYANEVADADAWSAQLEHISPKIEVLNYGVGGYGVDQAYLRYRLEGRELSPDTVLMGFVADDLRRVVNVYRRFSSTSELPLFKPRYLLSPNGELTLLPSPVSSLADYEKYLLRPDSVREVGVYDHWYDPLVYENPLYDWSAAVRLASAAWIRIYRRYMDPDRLVSDGQFNEDSSAFSIQRRLFRIFATDVAHAGARPIVVFFPDKYTVMGSLSGEAPVYAPLVRAARRDGVFACDLYSPFRSVAEREGVEGLFMPAGHYSPRANEIVAQSMARVLRALAETMSTKGEAPDFCRSSGPA